MIINILKNITFNETVVTTSITVLISLFVTTSLDILYTSIIIIPVSYNTYNHWNIVKSYSN